MWRQLPRPPLPDNAVRLKILRSTATYTDLLTLSGNYRPPPPFPATPGYDCIGIVVAVGPRVQALKEGDLCAGMPQHGSFATEIVLREDRCYKLPADVNLSEAAALPLTGMTAYQMLHRFRFDRRFRETIDTIWDSRHRISRHTNPTLLTCASTAAIG